MGLAGVVVQSAPAIGPTLTGLFVDLFSWRMPFYLVSAIAAVAFILGFFFVENNTKTKDIVLDKISVVYSTFGFGLILFAFSSVSTFRYHLSPCHCDICTWYSHYHNFYHSSA